MKLAHVGNDDGELEFRAHTGMLVDLDKLHESVQRTPRTSTRWASFEVTAVGEVEQTESEIVLNINGTNRQFVLVNDVEKSRSTTRKGARCQRCLKRWRAVNLL